jgi:glycosyltransferase involved in cell wall biosynthesis
MRKILYSVLYSLILSPCILSQEAPPPPLPSRVLLTEQTSSLITTEILREKIFLDENSFISSSNEMQFNPKDVCIFTISAWNNFGFVQAFFDSVQKSNPHLTCYIWVVADTPNIPTIILNEINLKKTIHLITVKELMKVSSYSIEELAFKFDLVEFSTTIKPLAFLYLFQILKIPYALYFDNDVWVTHSLNPLINILTTKLTVLTPHISVPIPEDGKHQRDINILKAGVLNFGFVSFTNHPKSLTFISWWYERLRYYGYVALDKGMHFDQNWGHFIFVFFNSNEYYIIRDNRYNIAYWNLHYIGQKIYLHDEEKRPYVNQEPVVFMHLSGISLFEEYDLNTISRHQNRYNLDDFPALEAVLVTYIQHVSSFQVEIYRKIPYGYNYFSDKTLIPSLVKQYYIQITDEVNIWEPNQLQIKPEAKDYFQSLQLNDPFLVTDWLPYTPSNTNTTTTYSSNFPGTFSEFLLNGPYNFITDLSHQYYFSELEHIIYRQRPDLQHIFPDPFNANYWDFKHWFSSSVPTEYNIRGGLLEMWRRKVNTASRMMKLGSRSEELTFGITVIGWHDGMFGVGISAAMTFNNLLVAGGDVNAMTLYGASVHQHIKGRIPLQYLTRSSTKPINIFVANADNTPYLHEVYPEPLWSRHYNIGVWAWELDLFPSDWMAYLSHFDEIWVPSTFIQKAILSSSLYSKYLTPVHVFPFGYSKQKAQEQALMSAAISREIPQTITKVIDIPARVFVFFVVFDYYSVFERKNPLAVIKAFQEAFPSTSATQGVGDNTGGGGGEDAQVMLIIKSSKPNKLFANERKRLLETIGTDHRIHLIEKIVSDEEMKLLFHRMDCYVSLHRSEGYGINILEAMLAGKPTIATDYGGNADFFAVDDLIRQVHFPIAYDLISVMTTEVGGGSGGGGYNPYQQYPEAHWAQPKHIEAVEAMRSIVKRLQIEDPSSATRMALARDKLKGQFGDEEVGRRMLTRLQSTNWRSKVDKNTLEGKAVGGTSSLVVDTFSRRNKPHGNSGNEPGGGRGERSARIHKRVVGGSKYGNSNAASNSRK